MSKEPKLADPNNKIVCVFDELSDAEAARQSLLGELGLPVDDVVLLLGKSDTDEIETSAKWFADTDEEMKRFESELLAGNFVFSVSVRDHDCRDQILKILQSRHARHVTHFGDIITEVIT